MRVVVIVHCDQTRKPEDFAPILEPQSQYALTLFAEEKIREIYSLADDKGALLIVEANNVEEARQAVESSPMAKAGLMSVEVYGLKPYRGFTQHLKTKS